MGESDPRAVADDRSGPAIRLDYGVARAIGFCSVLPCAAGAGFTQAGMGGGKRVRRRHGCGGATDCRRGSQVARTDPANCARVVVAAEEFHEPGTARCCIADQCCTSGGGELAWGFAAGRAFGRPSCGTVHGLATRPSAALFVWRHLLASDCGHWIHLDHPELVTEAICEVVTAARSAAQMEASARKLQQ